MHLAEFNNSGFASPSSLVVGIAVISLLLVAVKLVFRPRPLGQFPLNGRQYGGPHKRMSAYLYHAESLYHDGYSRFKKVFYRMTTTDGERLMVPNVYLDELKKQPGNIVNNVKVLTTMIESKYTGISAETPFLNHMVRADLTRNLPRINPRLSEEVNHTVLAELPNARDWTPVQVHPKLLRIVAIVSGNIFIGPDLCHSEDYIYSSIRYSQDLFAAVRALKMWPRLLRPIARFSIPELKLLHQHRDNASRFLVPIIEKRRAEAAAGGEQPDDMLQWMINKSDKFDLKDDAELARQQLTLSQAAIHTTALTATQILYDLVANPEIIEPLRNEIQTVLKDTDGVMTTNALFRMKLLDSVMRESQRVNPSGMIRFARYIEKPITFHDGTTIPADVVIEAPHLAITRDPELYPDPDTFNPYRFYRLRSGEDKDPIGYKTPEQYQFVTVTKENLSFGFGPHACPGRFFAANEIKLVMARLILDFDFEMPDGQKTRYKNIVQSGSIVPDASKEILIRRRPVTGPEETY